MIDNNILISWNQSINEWIQQLYLYIEKTDYFGLYILGDKWTNLIKEIDNIQIMKIENVFNYENFFKFIDHTENIIMILNKISNNIITQELSNYTLSDMGISYKKEYNDIIKKIFNMKKESDDYLKLIIDNIPNYVKKILKNNKNEDIIHFYEKTSPHLSTSMEIYLEILKQTKQINLLEPYKKMILGIIKEDYKPFDFNINNIQHINYLIRPFINSKETKNTIDISISNQIIDYNVLPLIDKIEALKFGSIQFIITGINKQLINRFKTIKVNKVLFSKIPNRKNTDEIVTPLNVYTGFNYKNIIPINFKEGYKWKPMNGVDVKVYKYNELLEKSIFKNMKIDKTIYNSFKSKDYQPIASKDLLNNNKKSVSELCYEELNNFLNRKSIDDINIIREMYLLQFFNINKIIDNIKQRDEDSIEIIPIVKILAIFKLI